MTGRTRRSVLIALGGTAALAGCISEGTDGSPDAGSGDARLGRLRVANNDDTSHRVAVQIERDGEIASWTTHDLDARSAGDSSVATVSSEGVGPGAEITIEVQIDGERHRQFAVEGGCQNVLVEIDDEGEMTKFDGECSAETTPTTESG